MARPGGPERLAAAGALAPGAWILASLARDGLGANPVEELVHRTGSAALVLLLASLAVSPLGRAWGTARLRPARRVLGLAALAWAGLHAAITAVLDLGLDPALALEELRERPHMAAGAAALALLLPLGATSNRASMRRLGRRWKLLHRLVYLAGALAVLHVALQGKFGPREAAPFAAALAALLAARLPPVRRWLTRR